MHTPLEFTTRGHDQHTHRTQEWSLTITAFGGREPTCSEAVLKAFLFSTDERPEVVSQVKITIGVSSAANPHGGHAP
jgi:hypothetical protein